MKKQNILVFDVESTSLHGKAFAVGAIVVNAETGEEVANFILKSYESEKDASEWVKTNVLPWLKDMPAVPTDRELRDRFWKFYQQYLATSYIWADVAYPVETNFLEQLYQDSPEEREFGMPYPLYDVANHVNPDVDRNEFCEVLGLAKHNPYDDAKASAYSLLKHRDLTYGMV